MYSSCLLLEHPVVQPWDEEVMTWEKIKLFLFQQRCPIARAATESHGQGGRGREGRPSQGNVYVANTNLFGFNFTKDVLKKFYIKTCSAMALLNVITLFRPWPLIFVWKPDHKNLHHIPKVDNKLIFICAQNYKLDVHFFIAFACRHWWIFHVAPI